MDAIKQILGILFFIPFLTFGQKSIYPKDTIYVKFEHKIGPKNWNKKFEYKYEKIKGIYFNIEHIKGDMAFFYDFRKKSDTLCIKYLKDYTFLNLTKIEKKEIEYYEKRFGRIPWVKNKNAVFYTFLIEIISREKFVVYPVIWRSEGIID